MATAGQAIVLELAADVKRLPATIAGAENLVTQLQVDAYWGGWAAIAVTLAGLAHAAMCVRALWRK